ncbi:MAG: hypothetical protein IJI14_02810 [Anaerolineaceae bacterium]|nr:hypothetical protein [Anaerolineaceae bacterium]
MNPELKTPKNAAGVIIIIVAFAVHAADLLEYKVPVWLVIAAWILYPVGFLLLITADKK